MAVPNLGSLSLRGIRRELGNNNYYATNTYTNISLKNMSTGVNGTINTGNTFSNRPDGIAPHRASEFRLYDHDISSVSAPSVSTSTASVSGSVLTCSGNVTSNGGATLSAKGVIIHPTNSGLTLSSSGITTSTHPSTSTGSYSVSFSTNSIIVGPNGTTYYYRAYATNSQGTSYGTINTIFIPFNEGLGDP